MADPRVFQLSKCSFVILLTFDCPKILNVLFPFQMLYLKELFWVQKVYLYYFLDAMVLF